MAPKGEAQAYNHSYFLTLLEAAKESAASGDLNPLRALGRDFLAYTKAGGKDRLASMLLQRAFHEHGLGEYRNQ